MVISRCNAQKEKLVVRDAAEVEVDRTATQEVGIDMTMAIEEVWVAPMEMSEVVADGTEVIKEDKDLIQMIVAGLKIVG